MSRMNVFTVIGLIALGISGSPAMAAESLWGATGSVTKLDVQRSALGDTIVRTMGIADSVYIAGAGKPAKALNENVYPTIAPGESALISATLAAVSTYSANLVSISYGVPPPDFISVSDAKSSAVRICCGAPEVSFVVSVAPDAPAGAYSFAVQYSYSTTSGSFVGLDWVGVFLTIPEKEPVPLEATPSLRWYYPMGSDPVYSTPVIGVDGTVYVGSLDDYLYALTSAGNLKWRYRTGGNIYSSPAVGSDGTVYVGSGDGYLYALTATGSLKWRYETGDRVDSSPTVGSDGTIYVGSYDGYIYALTSAGVLKWRYQTQGFVISSPTVGSDGNIYVGSRDGYVYALTSAGSLKWRFQTGDLVWSSPAVGPDGTIYVGSFNGYFVALTNTGTLKWYYQMEGIHSSPSIGGDGTIYVGSDDGYLYALTSAGSLRWRYKTGGEVYSSPAIGSDGSIYVGSEDYYVYALTSTGSLKWRYQTGGRVESSPVIGSNGTIYVGSYAIGGRANTAPILSSGTVEPKSGDSQTEFVFAVTYTDADNDEPPAVTIQLDSGSPVAMTKRQATSAYSVGVVYEYRTKLQTGTHTYLFSASDGVALAEGSGTLPADITVTAPITAPVAAFTASATTGTAPLTVQFTNTSTGTGNTYAWNFGDGGTGTTTSISHTFTTAGNYTVQLTATNAGGSNSTTRKITVTAPAVRLLARAIVGNTRVKAPQTVEAGTALRFEVSTFTKADTSDLQTVTDFTWTVPSRLGTATTLGQMSVATVAGVSDSIIFQRQSARTSFRLTIGPSTVSKVTITPANASVKLGQKQQFTAQALDRFNNRVQGQTFNWHVVGGIGTIDRSTGLFTAGRTAGRGFVIAGTVVNGGIIFGDNSASASGTARVVVGSPVPEQVTLYQNAPNPFNPSTEISFDLPDDGQARLTIYNLVGQEVARLADQPFPAGNHIVQWDATGQPSGTYIYVLETGEYRVIRKMMLLR